MSSLQESLTIDENRDWMNRYLLILNQHSSLLQCLYYLVLEYFRNSTVGSENQVPSRYLFIYFLKILCLINNNYLVHFLLGPLLWNCRVSSREKLAYSVARELSTVDM